MSHRHARLGLEVWTGAKAGGVALSVSPFKKEAIPLHSHLDASDADDAATAALSHTADRGDGSITSAKVRIAS